MKLSEYSKLCKPLVEQYLKEIDERGFTLGFASQYKYTDKTAFLDECVEIILRCVIEEKLEKDCDYVTAFKEAGIIDGYLKSTSVLGKIAGGKIGNIFGKGD